MMTAYDIFPMPLLAGGLTMVSNDLNWFRIASDGWDIGEYDLGTGMDIGEGCLSG
jgi:hypothetical protein